MLAEAVGNDNTKFDTFIISRWKKGVQRQKAIHFHTLYKGDIV